MAFPTVADLDHQPTQAADANAMAAAGSTSATSPMVQSPRGPRRFRVSHTTMPASARIEPVRARGIDRRPRYRSASVDAGALASNVAEPALHQKLDAAGD